MCEDNMCEDNVSEHNVCEHTVCEHMLITGNKSSVFVTWTMSPDIATNFLQNSNVFKFHCFLSDPGKPGVRSMGPVVSKYVTFLKT